MLSEEKYNESLPKILERRKEEGKGQCASLEPEEPASKEDMEETVPPTQCLFCPASSTSIDGNVDHMSSTHGFFIPHADCISDMESFLAYLATVVYGDHECLYCGGEKGSLESVKTHMRDKGHCKVKMEDVREFWNDDEEEENEEDLRETIRDEKRWRLPSGAIINSKSNATSKPRLAQSRTQHRLKKPASITSGPTSATETPNSSPPDSRLAIRNAKLSLAGVPASEIRALQRTEKKMKTREAMAKTAYRHAMEQGPVLTKYYKTENPVYQAG